MLPGYNPEEVVEGAAGGDGGADIRPQVQTLMDAMRQLLNNMQHVPEPEPQDEEGGNLPEEWDCFCIGIVVILTKHELFFLFVILVFIVELSEL